MEMVKVFTWGHWRFENEPVDTTTPCLERSQAKSETVLPAQKEELADEACLFLHSRVSF